jgi:hypothetical protein
MTTTRSTLVSIHTNRQSNPPNLTPHLRIKHHVPNRVNVSRSLKPSECAPHQLYKTTTPFLPPHFLSSLENTISSSLSQMFTHALLSLPLFPVVTALTQPASQPLSCACHLTLSPTTSLAIQPPLQIDALRCANLCRLVSTCGGFAATGKQEESSWCFMFGKDV